MSFVKQLLKGENIKIIKTMAQIFILHFARSKNVKDVYIHVHKMYIYMYKRCIYTCTKDVYIQKHQI